MSVSPVAMPSDEALIGRIVGKDADALAMLYDRHGRAAYGLAMRTVRDPLVADEVVQEAFLRLWQRAGTYDETRGTARTWLLRIVHHRAVDELRRSRCRPVGVAVEAAQALVGHHDTEAAAILATDVGRVRAALARLSVPHRIVVELAFLDGLTYPEVARRTGVPLGTVKSRMRVALERLRLLLETPPEHESAPVVRPQPTLVQPPEGATIAAILPAQ